MDRLPLLRISEVAFLAGNFKECVDFYRRIGMQLSPNPVRLDFARVGEGFFGVCNEDIGFFDGLSGGYLKSRLHVAFEVPSEQLDDCISFLQEKGIKTSPKYEWEHDFHGVPRSTSVYFMDPAGNIIELYAPRK